MKSLLTATVLLIMLNCCAQTDTCHCKILTPILSVNFGFSHYGTISGAEIGFWNRKNGLGLLLGGAIYDLATKQKDSINYIPSTGELYLKALVKLDRNDSSKWHHAIGIFVGNKGDYGGFYRFYYLPGNDWAVGIQPQFSVRTRLSFNFIVTFAL